jgi:hypothetical protein
MTNGANYFERSEALRKAREQGAAKLTYQVEINEYQRDLVQRMLVVALQNPEFVNQLKQQAGDEVPMGSAYDEAVYLAGALGENLTKVEDDAPGMLHGLCH